MMELAEILQQIQHELFRQDIRYIVLDDDPTGTQCSNDIYVYLKWDQAQIRQLFCDAAHPVSFILTNSRSLSVQDTAALHASLMKTILQEAKASGIDFRILSRSDSTLRWNYPAEVDAIRTAMEQADLHAGAEIICPCFLEAGRLTRNNIHYAVQGQNWIPAAETEFAKDKTFAFHSSDLREYIREKRKTAIPDEKFICISNEELEMQSDDVLEQLLKAEEDQKIIINAVNERQLSFFVLQYVTACSKGRNFLYRGASSFLRYLMKKPYIPLLGPQEMGLRPEASGGLIVAGSHVDKTTRQLQVLIEAGLTDTVIFHQSSLLESEEAVQAEVQRCAEKIDQIIRSGRTVCYMTERKRIDLPDGDEQAQLAFAGKISEKFLAAVSCLHVVPSFVIGKGGITSCRLGEMIMHDRRVLVMGQIEKGISVWHAEENALFPQIPYVIFPGNVGDDSTLLSVVKKMMDRN